MPNIKSAKKRVKVTKVKNANNQAAKTELRTIVKKFEAVAAAKDTSATNAAFKAAAATIDKAAAKGILHKNTAARKKSALALKLNAAK